LNKRPSLPTQLNPELPIELERIIEKALEKNLDHRCQSAAELRTDLQHLKQDTESGHQTAGSSGPRGLPEARTRETRNLWKFVAPALLLAALVAGGLYSRSHQIKPITDKDTIILADFTNTTGDAVFDGTLRQGLAAQLEQSPFLSLISDERIANTLSLMTQPKDARLTHQLAQEVCQRTASAATIEGSIATLGSQYVVGLKAVNCRNGDPLAEEQVTANAKEQVLKALGEAATRLRERLGESLGSVQKYDAPPEDVTTSSLDALNAYSLGLKARHEKGDIASIPLFRRAVQLDPQFAMAYLKLGIEYWNIGETNQARQNCIAAFALRDRVSARERFQIEADCYDVTGNLQKAEENFQLWAQTYPQDPVPLDHLGNDYLFSGQYPQALEALLEEKKLAKDGYFNYTNLVYAYLALNRLHDARLVTEQARARGLEPAPGYLAMYTIDFLEGNLSGMQEDVSWAAGKEAWEARSVDQQSDTEAYWGHRRRAWDLSQKAVAVARRENENEIAARFIAYAALRETEFGNSARAVEGANSALRLAASNDVKTIAALALARAGSTKPAQTLVDELAKASPSDTLLNLYWLPTIRASTDLQQNRPSQAIDTLQAAAPYELGQPAQMGQATLYPVYVRGEAYLRLGEAVSAATEFQKLLDHPGCVMNFLLGALAHLQLGRAYALAGDKAKSRIAYQDFFSLWKDADPDVPILKQAKAEYAKLQ
jgi:Flp pilus assembly protein TadD